MNNVKKGKLVFWLIILVFAVLIVFQNQEFFFSMEKLDVDLFFTQFTIPLTPVAAMFVIVFLIGWLISYIPAAIIRYRLQKTNKMLNQQLEAKKSDLASLKGQVETLKAKQNLREESLEDTTHEASSGKNGAEVKPAGGEEAKEESASASERSEE